MYPSKMGCNLKWSELAENTVQWWSSINIATSLRVLQNQETRWLDDLLSNGETISPSIPMMMTKMVLETSVQYRHMTWLTAREESNFVAANVQEHISLSTIYRHRVSSINCWCHRAPVLAGFEDRTYYSHIKPHLTNFAGHRNRI